MEKLRSLRFCPAQSHNELVSEPKLFPGFQMLHLELCLWFPLNSNSRREEGGWKCVRGQGLTQESLWALLSPNFCVFFPPFLWNANASLLYCKSWMRWNRILSRICKTILSKFPSWTVVTVTSDRTKPIGLSTFYLSSHQHVCNFP